MNDGFTSLRVVLGTSELAAAPEAVRDRMR